MTSCSTVSIQASMVRSPVALCAESPNSTSPNCTLKALAKELKVWLLIGSIGVKAPDGKIFNRSFMISPSGIIAARYDKIHMFDIQLSETEVYRESTFVSPGSAAAHSRAARLTGAPTAV